MAKTVEASIPHAVGIEKRLVNYIKAQLRKIGLAISTFSTVLEFNDDEEVYFDATGQTVTFTLNTNGVNLNGIGKLIKLNKPTAVNWPVNFIAHPSSIPLDSTKLNVYLLIYHSDWDSTGTPKVVYSNAPF